MEKNKAIVITLKGLGHPLFVMEGLEYKNISLDKIEDLKSIIN